MARTKEIPDEIYDKSSSRYAASPFAVRTRLTRSDTDGASPSVVLTSHPSPTVSAQTATARNSDDNDEPSNFDAVSSRATIPVASGQQVKVGGAPTPQIGKEEGVIMAGRRIRCKMCRYVLSSLSTHPMEAHLSIQTRAGRSRAYPRSRDWKRPTRIRTTTERYVGLSRRAGEVSSRRESERRT